ncbi:MAG: macro domain-containing protein, partial [Alphaproteobacteria bacterium]
AFPAISTGIFGYPVEQAAEIALGEARSYSENPGGLQRIVFCCFGHEVTNVYRRFFDELPSN